MDHNKSRIMKIALLIRHCQIGLMNYQINYDVIAKGMHLRDIIIFDMINYWFVNKNDLHVSLIDLI